MALVNASLASTCRSTGEEFAPVYDINPFPHFPLADQKNSGRCWLFATCNLLRTLAHKSLRTTTLAFSPAYLLFYDKLERYERNLRFFLRVRHHHDNDRYRHFLYRHALEDGGQWDMAKDLLAKYGIVPYAAMPDRLHATQTFEMNGFLMNMLRQDFEALGSLAARDAGRAVGGMVARARDALVRFLGEPPTEFSLDYLDDKNRAVHEKRVSPIAMLAKLRFVPGDWIMLADDPRHEPHRAFYLRLVGNVLEKQVRWVTVTAKEMRDVAERMLRADYPVWFGCDVHAQRDGATDILDTRAYNYANVGLPAPRGDKRARLRTYASAPQHAMLIRAYNSRRGVWEIENSWKEHQYMRMTDAWFDEYVFQIIAHVSLVPPRALEAYRKQAASPIEPWDPMGTLA